MEKQDPGLLRKEVFFNKKFIKEEKRYWKV